MGETTQTALYLDVDIIKAFKKKCIDEGVSMSKKIETLISKFLAEQEKEGVTNGNHGPQ